MKKSEVVVIRVTPEEKREIERTAARLGMTVSEATLKGIEVLGEIIKKHREEHGKSD